MVESNSAPTKITFQTIKLSVERSRWSSHHSLPLFIKPSHTGTSTALQRKERTRHKRNENEAHLILVCIEINWWLIVSNIERLFCICAYWNWVCATSAAQWERQQKRESSNQWLTRFQPQRTFFAISIWSILINPFAVCHGYLSIVSGVRPFWPGQLLGYLFGCQKPLQSAKVVMFNWINA